VDYKRTPEWWQKQIDKSSEDLTREFGGTAPHWRRARRNYDSGDKPTIVRKGIAVFDLHHPIHDKKLWANILRFTEDFDPDIFVFGGDNMNLDVISHWIGNKRRKVEGQRLKKDYERFNNEVMDPLDDILRDDVERHFLLGNHEAWVEQYIDEHPEVEGFFEVRENVHLDGWSTYDYGQVAKLGKLWVTHGTYINIHNALKTAQVYGRNVMYGHGHTAQSHTVTTPLDVESHMAVQVPCVCNTNPEYRKNQPNGWLNGLAAFYIQADGTFNLYTIVASDGGFTAPTGVHYE
jgi:hypothetical protein